MGRPEGDNRIMSEPLAASNQPLGEGSDPPLDPKTKTQYTLQQLDQASREAGTDLYEDYEHIPTRKVVHGKLSRFMTDPEAIVDASHIFYPSSKTGIGDVSDMPWEEATPDWADKDGNVYTKHDDVILVTHEDKPWYKITDRVHKMRDRRDKHSRQYDRQLRNLLAEEPDVKFGKLHKGQTVFITKEPQTDLEKFTRSLHGLEYGGNPEGKVIGYDPEKDLYHIAFPPTGHGHYGLHEIRPIIETGEE